MCESLVLDARLMEQARSRAVHLFIGLNPPWILESTHSIVSPSINDTTVFYLLIYVHASSNMSVYDTI